MDYGFVTFMIILVIPNCCRCIGGAHMADVAYQKVFNVLRQTIIEKRLEPGEKVPPERILCETYGVSRITVRHALRLLEEQGLVERLPGKGTFVRALHEKKMPVLDLNFEKSNKKDPPNIVRKVLTCERILPPDKIIQRLGFLKSEECLLIERLDMSNNEPLSYDQGYIPLNYTSSIDDEILTKVEFLNLWEERENLVISYIQSTTEAVIADSVAAERLSIDVGSPILLTTDTTYDVDGKALAVFITLYRGDRYQLVSTNYGSNRLYTKGYTV